MGKRLLFEENAGGQSEYSEAFSYEILHKILNIKLKNTEMEIKYWLPNWKKTDYSIQFSLNNGRHINLGVSVTRAMKFKGIFDEFDAYKLLKKKLYGINESTKGVLDRYSWNRQILFIWTNKKYIRKVLQKMYLQILFNEPELVSNTIVMICMSFNTEWLFYQNKYITNTNKPHKKVKKKRRIHRINKSFDNIIMKILYPIMFVIIVFLLVYIFMIDVYEWIT